MLEIYVGSEGRNCWSQDYLNRNVILRKTSVCANVPLCKLNQRKHTYYFSNIIKRHTLYGQCAIPVYKLYRTEFSKDSQHQLEYELNISKMHKRLPKQISHKVKCGTTVLTAALSSFNPPIADKCRACSPCNFAKILPSTNRVNPSFNQKCSKFRLVTKFPVQLWLISCATTSAKDLSPACRNNTSFQYKAFKFMALYTLLQTVSHK